jgi:uncharacterized protein YegL
MNPNGQSEQKEATVGGEPLTAVVVLDKSGSMRRLRETVVDAYNVFCDELRSEEGDVRVSLTSFDTRIRHLYVAQPLAEVAPLHYGQYVPNGGTALYDAIAHAALETDRRLTAEGRAGERVLLAVITDGQENSSTDYDAPTLARLVADYEERGNWTFVYLGAAHTTIEEARATATSFGLKGGNAMRWQADRPSTLASMEALASGVKARRASPAKRSDKFFDDAAQSESDYLGQNTTPPQPRRSPRPTTRPAPFQQRPLSDQLPKETR